MRGCFRAATQLGPLRSRSMRQGIVYIAEELDDEWEPGQPRFRGHWQIEDATDTFLEGPGWDDPNAAVAWGRERAPEVYIRIGRTEPQTYYSAGVVHDAGELADDPLPRWPPEDKAPT